MRWADINLNEAVWIIPASSTKSDRKQLVPLSAPVLEIIKSVPRFGEFVFTSDGNTHLSGYAKGKARLDSFIAATGSPMTPWRLHDLRRTAATEMVRLGVLETVVGRVLNHAVQGVTAKVYALHSYAPEKRNALDRWAAEVARAINGNAAVNVVPLRG
jgi:integrase